MYSVAEASLTEIAALLLRAFHTLKQVLKEFAMAI